MKAARNVSMKDNIFAWLLVLFIGLNVFSGGNFVNIHLRPGILALVAFPILANAFWKLRNGLPNRNSGFLFLLFLLGVGLMVAQLVPLPVSLWSQFNGRQFLREDLQIAGANSDWLPISLSPEMTKQNILSLLPALALFFGVISLLPGKWKVVVSGVFVISLISAVVGLAQKFQGPNGIFNFYLDKDVVSASGFFANRNFQAGLLYSSIPLIAGLALDAVRTRALPSVLIGILSVTYIAIIIAAIGATGSRMGALLAMVSVLSSGFLLIGAVRTAAASRFGVVAAVLLVIAFSQLCLTALLRITTVDAASDYRSTIYAVSLKTLYAFFPIGSGFGSFVPAYQLFETAETLQPAYINHAHNDWLELLIEGGLPMAIILVGFLGWFLHRLFKLWGSREASLLAKAASISAFLLLAHSLIDYPLRTPALMALFGVFCAMMAVGGAMAQRNRPIHRKPDSGHSAKQLPAEFKARRDVFAPRQDNQK
jgi:O-antigen ligase